MSDELRAAALDVIEEYRSHGGDGIHQTCDPSACCTLAMKILRLECVLNPPDHDQSGDTYVEVGPENPAAVALGEAWRRMPKGTK